MLKVHNGFAEPYHCFTLKSADAAVTAVIAVTAAVVNESVCEWAGSWSRTYLQIYKSEIQ